MKNNKGMTLVELIITFALLLVLIVGMYNLILDIKFQMDEKQIMKDASDYASVTNNEIHYHLLKEKPIYFAVLRDVGNLACYDINNEHNASGVDACDFGDGIGQISLDTIKSDRYCNGNDECVVYWYKVGDGYISKVIALSKRISKFGVLYGKSSDTEKPILDVAPNLASIETYDDIFTNDGDEEKSEYDVRIYMDTSDSENRILVINFPFFVKDNTTNLGFKIAYPIDHKK